MSKDRKVVMVLAGSPEEYKRGVERCIKLQEDFLEEYTPVWCGGSINPIMSEHIFIDCREQSVQLQEYNVEYEVC